MEHWPEMGWITNLMAQLYKMNDEGPGELISTSGHHQRFSLS